MVPRRTRNGIESVPRCAPSSRREQLGWPCGGGAGRAPQRRFRAVGGPASPVGRRGPGPLSRVRRPEDDRPCVDRRVQLQTVQGVSAGPRDAGQPWPFGWEREAWSQSWAGYRGLLAANLDDAEFEPLAAAFGFVEQLQNSPAAGRRPFQDADATFLEDVRKAVDGALRMMSPRPRAPD